MLLQDKNNAIAKQANRLALKSVLTFQNEWDEKVEEGAGKRKRSGRNKQQNSTDNVEMLR